MIKVGILGGGQLGRMLLQAAANYPVETYVMENDEQCPAAHLCHHFIKGDIRNFDDVYRFGQGLQALTIEIESVNEDALAKLESEGVLVYPRTSALRTIKNKITQKQFYSAHSIPTAEYIVTENLDGVRSRIDFLPAVHKIGMGGYDGKGVKILHTMEDVEKGFNAPSVLERLVPVDKEIAQIIAVGQKGETAIYPPVDMVFDPRLNLLDYQISPAELSQNILWKMEAVSLRVVKELKSPGIFAVELFVTRQGDVYVNETAPRVHNSGHHTIEANYSSQFDMLWRVILGYPLGNTEAILPGAIVNLIGEAGSEGEAHYEGLDEVLQMDNVFVHIYGKSNTRAGRKMGHVTIISREKQDLIYKAHKIKNTLKVISKAAAAANAAAAALALQQQPVIEMRDRSIGR
jgi:5-(carboxyamino)imidazole ribonucleotide synthase